MKLITLLEKYDIYNDLNSKFPDMVKLSEEIEVIPWRDEFNIADKNPEVIENIEFLRILLHNNMISSEEYEKQLKKVSTGYASKTLGMAFIDKKQVSFRSPAPHPGIVLHELGHIYFGVNDLLWNASYGGGETLFYLALKGFPITEGHIRRYHAILEQIYENTDEVHRKIADAIAPNIEVYPHLFPVCLHAGYIPDLDVHSAHEFFEFFNDLKSEKWEKVPVLQHHLFSFFQNLVDGLKYNDPHWSNYAKWLGLTSSPRNTIKNTERKQQRR